MHLVCSSDGPEVPVVAVAEDFKPLMDEDVVNKKITEAVNSNAYTDIKLDVAAGQYTEEHEQHAGEGEDEEEGVVFFKEAGMTLVMVAVQDPKQAVHDILMGKPGHEFHEEERNNDGGDIDDDFHFPESDIQYNKPEVGYVL